MSEVWGSVKLFFSATVIGGIRLEGIPTRHELPAMADGLADEKAALLVRLGEDCAFHCAGLGGWRCHVDVDDGMVC